jgi:hypothetical protein
MAICIYCRCELPANVPPEHVIPQSFGVFTPDLTLDCVCKECNHFFGSTLEWPMRVESIEGARRLQFGLKGTVGGIGTKGVMPTIAEGPDWKGARTVIRTNADGTEVTEVLPQVGARRTTSDQWEWCLAHELTTGFADRYPKGSEFRIVGGRNEADNERLVEKLKAVCPTFLYGGKMNPPFSGDGKVMLNVEHQLNRTGARCLCKIAFNYAALTCGSQFVLSSEYDDIRSFIRYDKGTDEGRVFVKHKPIIAHEIINGQRITDGHILTLEGRTDAILEVQLALFNSIPYRIPLTRQYQGHRYIKGHHFDLETRKVSEMMTAITGPDFDPQKFMEEQAAIKPPAIIEERPISLTIGPMKVTGLLFLADPPEDSFIRAQVEVLGIIQMDIMARVDQPMAVEVRIPEGPAMLTITYDFPSSAFLCQLQTNNAETEVNWHVLAAIKPS